MTLKVMLFLQIFAPNFLIMIKGFIFDMDGTMIDNMMVHHRAWQQKLKEYGIDWSLAEVHEKVHGVNVELLERLFGNRFTLAERIQISKEKEIAYRNIYQSEIKLIDGLKAFLEAAKAANIPMAIATAAPPENAYFVLENLPIRHYFKALFHSDDVTKGKPDPEVFELAAKALGLPLQDCLIFEDSVTGAEAAYRAGCSAVILTTSHKEAEFSHYPHILQFAKDYRSINLKELLVPFSS